MIERSYIFFIQIIIHFWSIQLDGMEKEINFCVECAVDWFEKRLKLDSFFSSFLSWMINDARFHWKIYKVCPFWGSFEGRKKSKKPLSVVRNSKESISANQTNNLPRSQKQWNVICLQQQQPLNRNNQIDPFFFRSSFINIFFLSLFQPVFLEYGNEKNSLT